MDPPRRQRAPVVEQIEELPRVDLEERARERDARVAAQTIEHVVGGEGDEPLVGGAMRLVARPHHGVGLAGAGLAVGEARGVHALEDRLHQRRGRPRVDVGVAACLVEGDVEAKLRRGSETPPSPAHSGAQLRWHSSPAAGSHSRPPSRQRPHRTENHWVEGVRGRMGTSCFSTKRVRSTRVLGSWMVTTLLQAPSQRIVLTGQLSPATQPCQACGGNEQSRGGGCVRVPGCLTYAG